MPVRSKTDGLSAPVHTIELPAETAEAIQEELLADCRYIGSYDWSPNATKGNPSIVIPGSPNVWSEPTLPFEVPADKGRQITDINNHILDGQPFLPLLASISTQRIFPRQDYKTIDFITDRNSLRKLLRWIGGASGKGFRIDTQLIGEKTVVFNRWEVVDTEFMRGNTYSLNFEKAVTRSMTPSTGLSAWHHRVVTYKFGQFRMVVQFEVDACLPKDQWRPATSMTEDELVDAMANIGFSNEIQDSSTSASSVPPTPETASEIFGIKVKHQGCADIPNSAIIELATKSSAGIGWTDRYPQLYLSQTGNLHMGNRRDNNFIRVDKFTRSSPQLLAVHQRLQPTFKKLEEALRKIQSIVLEHGKAERLSLVYDKPNLTVHKNLTDQSCLPPEALALFD
ncbi:hypothetical protein NP233_g2066 [Leucocoprinus birnbaumii]|uniref:Geranylgeranyl pyrophosphate synthetase n=1 Tax=Leucocoprinus birnbaumii TaxID=56174 RepID=A0AAD5YZA7_9AGAR|nr:hypothetical protein NP233_g2066 [Leucocoprinus birnbaumii]